MTYEVKTGDTLWDEKTHYPETDEGITVEWRAWHVDKVTRHRIWITEVRQPATDDDGTVVAVDLSRLKTHSLDRRMLERFGGYYVGKRDRTLIVTEARKAVRQREQAELRQPKMATAD